MPAQRPNQGGLLGKLGNQLKTAHEQHKNDETTYSGFGELPAGIENGIAQLVDCKFTQIAEGKENAGQYMFYAAGVVVVPDEVEGIPVKGLRTQISEVLFETPSRTRKTIAEHYAWILNEIRKLGVDTSQIGVDDIETTVAALKEAAPYFRFRTWKGEKTTEGPYAGREPRVQNQWAGACDYTPGTDGNSGVQDNTPPTPTQTSGQGTEPPKTGGVATGLTGDEDLAALASIADDVTNSDELRQEAGGKVQETAVELGISEDDLSKAENWVAVVALIEFATAKAAAEAEQAAAEAAKPKDPDKGDIYQYQVIDAKTRKPGAVIPVEVLVSDKKTKMVTIKNLSDKKTLYKGVKFSELLPPK